MTEILHVYYLVSDCTDRHMVTSLCSIDGLNSSPKSVLATNLQTRISESSSEAVTHLVGERVTAGMIQVQLKKYIFISFSFLIKKQ